MIIILILQLSIHLGFDSVLNKKKIGTCICVFEFLRVVGSPISALASSLHHLCALRLRLCVILICIELDDFFLSAAILPVVQKQHQLLVTLLLCNAIAMEVIDLVGPGIVF